MTGRGRAGVIAFTVALVAGSAVPALARDVALFAVGRELLVGVLFVAAGLGASARRPDSATGTLMTAAGLVWLLARVLVWAGDTSSLFTIGLVLVLVPIALIVHMAITFPSGRPSSGVERLVVVSSYVVIVAGTAFLDLDECTGCPTNLLAVDGTDGPGRALDVAVKGATLAAIAAVSLVLARHWRRGTPAARRTLAPVLPTTWLYGAVSGAQILEELGAPLRVGEAWAVVEEVSLLAIPLAFLGGLLRSRLAAAGVGTLVVELGEAPASGELRAAVAKALGDPGAELASWDPGLAGYRDAEGQPVSLPPEDDRRVVTTIERAGQRIGALVHDRAALEEPAVLDAVCAAAGLALENDRLHAEVLTRLEEVRASRARIVEAGDAARRRVERNLHDGAQQRLVTLSLALRMARSRLGPGSVPDVDALLAEAADELNAALHELRELAAGLHPPILTEEGLPAALEALAERSSVPVRLRVAAPDRLTRILQRGSAR
jgi:signal transduction histidine kinase